MFITKKKIKQNIKSDEKYYSVTFSSNSIDFKVLNNLIPYYSVRKIIYKGKNTDSLFIRVGGEGKNLLKLFTKYNKILHNLTYSEEALLNKIREKSYITKKYNFTDEPTIEDEIDLFKIYLPNEQVDCYDDYANYHNQDIFYTKRINYNKNYIKQDVVTKTLERATKILTDFKLSNLKLNYNSNNLMVDIFNIRLNQCSFKLHNNYHRVKNNYDSYEEFVKNIVYYGANHKDNNRFWREVKRELY